MSLPKASTGSSKQGSQLVCNLKSETISDCYNNSSSEQDDNDVMFSLRKRWIQFWNEPEYITIADGPAREGKDGLK